MLTFFSTWKNDLKLHEIGPGGFFPTNPDLAHILGDTDFDFENFVFGILLDSKFLDFQVPDFQISINLAWARLGPGLGLGPGGPSWPSAAALRLGRGTLGWAGRVPLGWAGGREKKTPPGTKKGKGKVPDCSLPPQPQ